MIFYRPFEVNHYSVTSLLRHKTIQFYLRFASILELIKHFVKQKRGPVIWKTSFFVKDLFFEP